MIQRYRKLRSGGTTALTFNTNLEYTSKFNNKPPMFFKADSLHKT